MDRAPGDFTHAPDSTDPEIRAVRKLGWEFRQYCYRISSMKPAWFRTAAVGVAALLLIAAYKRAEPSSVMADAANAFLNSLWPDQKAKASYAFDDDERLSWHFVPTGANYKPGDRELRKGMPLRSMQPFSA